MRPEDKQEALEQIEKDILFGFEKPDQLFESIREMFYDESDFDEEWLRQNIESRYNRHQKESQNWEVPTDFNRLASAFDELIEQQIVCLHNAGHTKSDGVDDCLEVINELAKLSVTVRGYCYYHSQDLSRAIDPEIKNLYIGFDSADRIDTSAIEVANRIVEILRKHNFSVSWPGTVEQRIEINNINWQKIPDDEDWGMERVIRMLGKKSEVKKPFWKFW